VQDRPAGDASSGDGDGDGDGHFHGSHIPREHSDPLPYVCLPLSEIATYYHFATILAPTLWTSLRLVRSSQARRPAAPFMASSSWIQALAS
jgi:hypothetical protein